MAVVQGGVRGLLQRRGLGQLPLTRLGSNLPPLEGSKEGLELYELKELIGRGSSGRVFRAVRKEDKLQVAIKLMGPDVDGGCAKHRQEFEIMKGVCHPNLVQALDYFQHPCGSALVLSYIPSVTLTAAVRSTTHKHTTSTTFMSEGKAKSLFRMLLDALSYLHHRRIIHSDVKSDNVLVASDLSSLHLTDFGSSRTLRTGDIPVTSTTINFSAPEVLAGEMPSEKHDVWGAGLCLYFMLLGRLPRTVTAYPGFEDFCDAVQAEAVKTSGEAWQAVSDECKAVIRHCLALDKADRPAAMVILEMSWLRRPEDRSGRRFSAPSTCGLKASGNETGNISSSSGDRAGALGTIEIGHQERKPAAVSIDVGSFRDTKHVMAKLLPIREGMHLSEGEA